MLKELLFLKNNTNINFKPRDYLHGRCFSLGFLSNIINNPKGSKTLPFLTFKN